MCAVSLTHSLRLCKPHLARHKYIISRHLLNAIKIRIILTRNYVFTWDCECARGCVTSLPVPLAIKGSARNRQNVRLTGRSPIQAGHAKNRPIPITGRSIGASLLHTFWGCTAPVKGCTAPVKAFVPFFLKMHHVSSTPALKCWKAKNRANAEIIYKVCSLSFSSWINWKSLILRVNLNVWGIRQQLCELCNYYRCILFHKGEKYRAAHQSKLSGQRRSKFADSHICFWSFQRKERWLIF